MSRPIKHRGKRKDNGEWIEGNYGYKSIGDKHLIMVETVGAGITPDTLRTVPNNWHSYFTDYEVDPETVGQYTGLQDRNGKEVYEGDIADYTTYVYCNERRKGVVVFDEKKCCYKLVPFGCYVTNAGNGGWTGHYFDAAVCADAEVIGDIYSDPHLLKGDDTDV